MLERDDWARLDELLDAALERPPSERQRFLDEACREDPERRARLAELLRRRPAKVNLIPFNAFAQTSYRRSSPQAIDTFRAILSAEGIVTVTRRARGEDIDAACGQLANKTVSA